jgi:hypothetical protein
VTDDALSKLTDQLSTENRAWVEQLSGTQRRELLQEWQNKGGNTGLGGVGTEQNSADADALVEQRRKNA